jgi:DNA end-binding protein Ku
MIQAKVQGRQVVQAPEPEHLAPVIDIMEALKASLAAGKKPVRSVTAAEGGASAEAAGSEKPKRGRKSAAGG